MRTLRGLLLLAALGLAACVEQSIPIGGIPDDDGTDATAPPPPGQIVFGGYGLNRLSFIWSKVEDTTFYRMLKKTGPGTGFSPIGGEIDGAGRGPFSYSDVLQVHLTDWSNTSYMFEACNVQGCTSSNGTLDLLPADSVHVIGYMKPLDPAPQTQFGYTMAYSADGATLAVTTCTAAVADTGSVYVFAYDGTTWTQQAKLKGSREIAGTEYHFGCSVALSGDGDVLAVGATSDGSPATGVNPERVDAGATQSGAVYVLRRTAGAWSEEAYIKASNTGANDSFGSALALSRDGATLAVGAIGEDSDAAGIDQTLQHVAEDNNLSSDSGAVYLFGHDDTGWSQQAYIKAADAKGGDWFGSAVALADDGGTLAVGAIGEDSAGFGAIDDCANAQEPDNCLQDSGAVYVFTLTSGVWGQQAYLKASNPGLGDAFGRVLALSADGNVLAASAPGEDSAATQVGGNQVDDCGSDTPANCSENSGAAYMFRRLNNVWSQEYYIKASNTEAGKFPASSDAFGAALALSGDGAILAVGAPFEDSFVSGVNIPVATNAQKNGSPDSGAAYVYRNGVFISFVKSSHGVRADKEDKFGYSVALSADGGSLAVGAVGNSCPFTGQPGLPVYNGLNQFDMQPDQALCGTPANSGAVYLY